MLLFFVFQVCAEYDGTDEVDIHFMKKTGKVYVWDKHTSCQRLEAIVCIMGLPEQVNNLGQFSFPVEAMILAKGLVAKSSIFK